jgi:galactose-1-phosphate uridylyltransferase
MPDERTVRQPPFGHSEVESVTIVNGRYPPNRTATKLKYVAGSETAAGAFINDTLPEETAPRLRELEPRYPAALTD